jgi:outer membrane receptor protein involved in Fe transport
MYYSRRFKVVSAIGLACFTAPLIAQTQIEEVLVTASKTGAVSTQDISSSVQAFNESTLEKMGVVEFTDFSRSVPGLDVIDKGPGQKTYIMRGISGPGESTVGVYIDNIPMIGSGQDAATSGGNQPDMGAFDMARIEVVRGPQGTLYGQNSVSGIVRYITNKPDASAFESRIQLDGAIVDEGSPDRALRGMVNIPLIDDTMALRLVGYTKSSGGFIDNVVLGKDAACYQRNLPNPGGNGSLIPELSLVQSAACGDGEVASGQEDVNSYTISGLRAQLGYEIDDASSLLLQFFRQETEIDNRTASNPFDSSYSIGPPFVTGSSLFFTDAAGQYETNVRSNEPHEDTSTIFGLEYERDLDWATLTVGLNSMERDITDSLDSSSPARLHRRFMLKPLGPWGGATLSRNDRVISHQEQGVEQKTFEARLAGELTDNLTYITGVYFQDLDTSLNSRVFNTDAQTGDVIAGQPLILHRIAGVEQTSKAIFGEAYFQVNDQIEIMGGLRWFEMERDQVSNLIVPFVNSVPIGGAPGDQPSNPQTYDDVTFKAQITYHPTDDVQLYLTSSEGFRSGGVNAQITPNIPPDFAPDTAKSLEFGVKSTWMDACTPISRSTTWFGRICRFQQPLPTSSMAWLTVQSETTPLAQKVGKPSLYISSLIQLMQA